MALIVSMMLLGGEIWFGKLNGAVNTLAFGFMVHIYHYTLLTGNKVKTMGSSSPEQSPGLMFWLAYIFPFLILIPVFITVMTSMDVQKQAFGLAILICVPIFILTLSLIGTMLPSAVLRQTASPIAALKRSKSTFWFILWRILVGPTLIFVIFVASTIWANRQGLIPETPSNFSEITPWTTLLLFPTMIGLFNSALTASILSMAYAKSQGETLPELQS